MIQIEFFHHQISHLLLIIGIKYMVGLESYGLKSGCFKHGEKWVQKLQHHKKEELIATQRDWGAGCYEVLKYYDCNTLTKLFTTVQMYS